MVGCCNRGTLTNSHRMAARRGAYGHGTLDQARLAALSLGLPAFLSWRIRSSLYSFPGGLSAELPGIERHRVSASRSMSFCLSVLRRFASA